VTIVTREKVTNTLCTLKKLRVVYRVATVGYFEQMSAAADQVPTQPEDLANFMDQIFTQMEQKFTDMAQQVLGRIDEMSQKINELEGAIDHLMSEADPDQAGGKS
jgi:heat shock factor-binding protein 1